MTADIPGVDLVYADAHLLVLHKPANMLSVPGRLPENKDSLALRVQGVFPDARIVHRLDCATSGLMIMARDAQGHRHLSKQFQHRQVDKLYLAVGHGEAAEDSGKVDLPLIVDWPNRPKSKVDHEQGKPSQTLWRVLSRADGCTRFELTPITGRSHQLRIHMAEIGHPLLGDPFYAPEPVQALSPRLLLHAAEITVIHPHTEERIHFHAPCPF